MNEQDGWFAGLIFDSERRARFTVATFIRRVDLVVAMPRRSPRSWPGYWRVSSRPASGSICHEEGLGRPACFSRPKKLPNQSRIAFHSAV